MWFRYDDPMRLFMAITVPHEIRQRLSKVCAPFAAQAVDTVWCKPEQLHVTLAFIGEAVPDSEAIIAALSGAKRLGRLPIVDPLTPDALAAAFAANFDLTDFQ